MADLMKLNQNLFQKFFYRFANGGSVVKTM